MPGVIMENGSRNGSHTNHDRDQRPNGINGGSHIMERMQDKGKGRVEPQQNMTPISPTIPNGTNGVISGSSKHAEVYQIPQDMQARIDQLPPEIAHITQGYMDLKTLVYRLAQKSHTDLLALVKEVAQMPSPPPVKTNGHGPYVPLLDENHSEGLERKARYGRGIEDIHTDWVKALVILGWSRRAEDVSKMIDLKIHLDEQNRHYTNCVETMAFDRRGLFHARLPNPDLKTAIEVMGTGKASWMPDHGYIQPPPLTAREVLKTLEKLNTILSIRLNLNDYDKVPFHFKNFSIKNGRVTFKVPGEFEVDLTIAEEDPEAQFWFIDIRFQFWPSLDILTPRLRFFIDAKMNDILREEGLSGCYKVLHEMVLTYKINEFRRQGIVLSTSIWTPTLKVELLHRSVSIQYWADRFDRAPKINGKTPKSWLIMGVHSGKSKDAHPDHPDPKTTSHLFIRWFRDSAEVKDVDIPFDDVNISMETLLRTVITEHTNHILNSVYEKLSAKPIYANRDLDLSLHISKMDGTRSELKVQLTAEHRLSIKIEPINGRFVFSPPSRRYSEHEFLLNTNIADPANYGHAMIERLRYSLILDGITTNARTVGWTLPRNPGVTPDEMSKLAKDAQIQWFSRSSWAPNWYLLLLMSMRGEQWVLVRTAITTSPTNPHLMILTTKVPMPIKAISPVATYGFLTKLSIYAAAMISYHENLKALWIRKDRHLLIENKDKKSQDLTLPSVQIRLSDLLQSTRNNSRTPKKNWAKDLVKLTFQGVEVVNKPKTLTASPPQPAYQMSQPRDENAVMVTEARMTLPVLKALVNMNEKVDRDIAFHPQSGSFAFRLRSKIGEPVISELIDRVIRVERVVEFVKVLERYSEDLNCESVSLGRIVFTYRNSQSTDDDAALEAPRYRATVHFSAKESSMALLLEKSNPQLRIVDHLTNVLNSSQGLKGVAVLLPLTLPVLRGLEAVEDSWVSPLTERGEVFINVRASDWYIIRYNLSQSEPPRMKKIIFEVRMKHRRGEPWWYIRRTELEGKREPDGLDEMLKAVWSDRGRGWMGMRVSGVAKADGVEELLGKINEVARTFALSDKVFAAPAPAPVVPMDIQAQRPQGIPQAQRPGQMQRQQPTPNQSQSQGHMSSQGSLGRGVPSKRPYEVITLE